MNADRLQLLAEEATADAYENWVATADMESWRILGTSFFNLPNVDTMTLFECGLEPEIAIIAAMEEMHR